ncbi:B2 protein-like [Battus philenor]|uniref:B2 protein-like n=1 Tax=Battus philenor TaxID=42288 RepID=UPI0035CFF0F6
MTYILILVSLVSLWGANASKEIIKFPPETVSKIKAVDAQCVSEVGASDDALQKTFPWNLPNNENNRKYLFCLCNKLKLAKDDGTFDFDVAKKHFTSSSKLDEIKKVFDECNILSEKDKYELAYEITDCFFNNAPVELAM